MISLELPAALIARERQTHYSVRYVESLLPIAKEDFPMIVVMRASATQQDIDTVLRRLEEYQLKGHLSRGEERTIIGVVGAVVLASSE